MGRVGELPTAEWISSGRVPLDDGPSTPQANSYKTGGKLYEQDAIHALRKVARVEVRQFPRPSGTGLAAFAHKTRYVVAFSRYIPEASLTVWEAGSLNYGTVRRHPGRRQVGLIHHLSPDLERGLRRILGQRYVGNLRRLDVVVTVAEYWRPTLLGMGARDVRVIHNAAPSIPVDFGRDELEALDRRYGFAPERPLVYLGTSQPEKGVVEAYRALASEHYDFVVTGGYEIPGLPVPRLELSAREYLLLLRRCDVAVLMSTFPEGWSRTAAEAMACGTPVVGSGLGGMHELLAGGEQVVCSSFDQLPEAVRRALGDREGLSRKGRQFTSQFTLGRFEHEWQVLAKELLA
jgi:glycosyltransferase involved in cell wall biosynthesis